MKLFFAFVRLSDRILLVVFVFSTILLLAVRYIFGDSFEQILKLSYVVYILTFLTTYIVSQRFSRRITNLSLAVEEIVGAISKLIHDRDLRSRNIERGRQRVREFSWETTAARVLVVLERAGRYDSARYDSA